MEFEDEVLREMCFIAPDNPADTDIGQAVLVSAVNAFSIDFGSIVLTPLTMRLWTQREVT